MNTTPEKTNTNLNGLWDFFVEPTEVWKAEIEPLSFGHVGQTIAQSVFMLSCSLVQMFGKSLRLVEMTNPRTFF